jgi:hypothetical protein
MISIIAVSQAAAQSAAPAASGFDPLLVFFGAAAVASLLLIVLLVRDGRDSLPGESTDPPSEAERHDAVRDVPAGR